MALTQLRPPKYPEELSVCAAEGMELGGKRARGLHVQGLLIISYFNHVYTSFDN
jgi:hypothetical protein